MRKGVYSSGSLRRLRLVPFGFRCGACGALNDGFYPLGVSGSSRDVAEEKVSASGQTLTQAELTDRRAREAEALIARTREQIASKKWGGSPNAIVHCGACGAKARWSRPSMRPWDWIVSLFIPFGIGVYVLTYEGEFLRDPRATLLGIILVSFSAALMLGVGIAMALRRRRIDRLPPESLPNLFGTPEALELWLNEQRREGEPLYRGVDPRSPEAAFLAEQNLAAKDAASPEPWSLCKWCLRTLTPGTVRLFEGRKYCPDCYGIVRQEAETQTFLRLHRKRGGDVM